jgi:excisionase family DNA binding protein
MNENFADHIDTLTIPLSVNEVAELLGIHRDTIYKWVRDGELPVVNVGATKTILRFPPKELAAWVRDRQVAFQGPARHISDWMEEQALRRGGPCFLPPLIPKVAKLTGYNWLATAQRVATDPNFAFAATPLMEDFTAAVNKLPITEQRQLLADIKTGKFDEPIFVDDDVR